MNDEQLQIILNAVNNTKPAFAKVKADVGSMTKGISSAQKTTSTASRKMSEGFKSMSNQAKLAFAVVGVAVIAFGKKAVDAAANLEETQSKFNVIFGDIQTQANEWAETFGRAMGRSEESMKAFTATTGDMLKPLGFATEEAFTLSKAMTTLALDVASFTNRQDADVIRAFQRALTGERESLKTLGIVISEADVKQEALRLGLYNGTGEIHKQAKALATINLLYANTADAQGDLARTAESYTNKMKALNAKLQDFMAEFGNKMLPAILVFVNDVMPTVEAALSGYSEKTRKAADDSAWLGKTVAMLVETFRTGFGFIKMIVVSVGRIITTTVAAQLDAYGKLGDVVLLLFTGKFKQAAGKAKEFARTISESTKGLVTDTLGDFSSWAKGTDESVQRISDLFDVEGQAAKKLKQELELKEFAKNDAEETQRSLDDMLNQYKGMLDDTGEETKKASEKMQKEFKKVEDSVEKIRNSFKDLSNDLRDLNVETAEGMAQAVVQQEEKIARLRADIKSEKDTERLNKLREELKLEEAALKEFNTVAIGLEKEIVEERRRSALTDFERRIEDLDRNKQLEIQKLNEKAVALAEQLQEQLDAAQKMQSSDKETAESTEEMVDDMTTGYSNLESKVGDSVDYLVKKNKELLAELMKFKALTAPTDGPDRRTFQDVVNQAGVPDPTAGGVFNPSQHPDYNPDFPNRPLSTMQNNVHSGANPMTTTINFNNPVIDSEQRAQDLLDKLRLALGRDYNLVTLGSQ